MGKLTHIVSFTVHYLFMKVNHILELDNRKGRVTQAERSNRTGWAYKQGSIVKRTSSLV
jgi:hypothetical protein